MSTRKGTGLTGGLFCTSRRS